MKRAAGAVCALLVSAVLAAGLAACGEAGPKTVTAADNGGTVKLSEGQELKIVLEGNPTTGYTWLRGEVDGNVIEEVGDYTFEPESTLAGAPGTFTFTYVAKGKGSAVINLDYARSWESVEPEETFSLAVTIQ
jgi:inhibitor of cysteine peptidase